MTEGRGVLARSPAWLTPARVVWLSAALALVAHLPSLLGGFVSDDLTLIRDNPFTHDLSYLGRCFATDLWDTASRPIPDSSTLFYRPLVCASFALNWKLGGVPWTFHVVNVACHAAVCALAARVALRWTRSAVAALVATAFLALHPSHTENVAWISGRADLLMALGFFAAEELAVRAAFTGAPPAAWAYAFGAWAFALLSKESAVFWPVWLAVEAALAAERGRDAAKKRLLIAAAASLGCVVLYLSLRATFLPLHEADLETLELSFGKHVAYVFLTVGYYAERLVFPWPQTLHFRPLPFVDGAPAMFWPSVVVGVAIAVGAGVWLAAAWKRDKTLALVLAVAVLVVLPSLNVTYTGFRTPTADRSLYLPSFLLGVAAMRHLRKRVRHWTATPRIALAAAGAVALVFTGIGWARAADYGSERAFWQRELELNRDDPHALNALARSAATGGDGEDAVALFRRALSPTSLKYRSLAAPTRSYVGLLALQSPRLADGNVSALSALLNQVVDLVRGAPLKARGKAGDLELEPPEEEPHFRVFVANEAAHLASSGALVASRLGRDDLVRLLVASLDERSPLDVADRYNLALSLGRGGDYSGARRQLAIAATRSLSPESEQAIAVLATTLEAVKEQRLRASSLPEPARAGPGPRLPRAGRVPESGAFAPRSVHRGARRPRGAGSLLRRPSERPAGDGRQGRRREDVRRRREVEARRSRAPSLGQRVSSPAAVAPRALVAKAAGRARGVSAQPEAGGTLRRAGSSAVSTAT